MLQWEGGKNTTEKERTGLTHAVKRAAALLLVLCLSAGAVLLPSGVWYPRQDCAAWSGELRLTGVQSLASGYTSDLEQAAAQVREQLAARAETFTVLYISDSLEHESIADTIFQKALSYTGQPTEGDYLKLAYSEVVAEVSAKQNPIDGAYYYTIDYTVTYYGTADWERAVDRAVEELLEQLALYDAEPYDKVKGVYDWICQNVAYDNDHLDDSSYTAQYTAYAALLDRSAVCHGYALLLYRLLLELGVNVRTVSGVAQGENHTWNLVELDGFWYNVDCTWDAPRAQAGADYDYFLLCDEEFADHSRWEEYTTASFCAACQMSPVSYSPQLRACIDDGSGCLLVVCAAQVDPFQLLRGDYLTLPGVEYPKQARPLGWACLPEPVLIIGDGFHALRTGYLFTGDAGGQAVQVAIPQGWPLLVFRPV